MDADAEADPAARRRAYREFVRTHHPDMGGDPDEFIAGLRRFHDSTPPAADDRRYEGQTVFYSRPRGLGRVTASWRGRRYRRQRAPRVL